MQKFIIKNITLENNLFLAPMAGYTFAAFRSMMSQRGVGLTFSEMASCKALLYDNKKTEELLKTSEGEKCVLQLFGCDPDDFSRSLDKPATQKFDIVDINMGCPVRKVVANGEGSALIGRPDVAAKIVRAVKNKGKLVSVKTRLGERDKSEILDFSKVLTDAGADMIVLHGRTAEQMYRGESDFHMIQRVKASASVPIVLSGDILDRQSFERAKATAADGFMVGRGALCDPFIFLKIPQWNCGKEYFAEESQEKAKKAEFFCSFIDRACRDMGERDAVVNIRKFLPYFLKDVRCKRAEKHMLNFLLSAQELKEGITELLKG
jgi:nifR3 family TIM-barrel protein